MRFPGFKGISRDADSPAITIFPERRLTDDEVRALHNYLNDPYLQSEFELRGRSQ